MMLGDQDGTLHVVTGINQAEQAFERAERDLGEGPCIDAFDAADVVWTTDLRRLAGHGWNSPESSGTDSDPGPPSIKCVMSGRHVR